MDKDRIDNILVERKLFESREKAKAALMAGIIIVDNNKIDKAGTKVRVNCDIVIKGKTNPYVSRGGYKLEKAMSEFHMNLKDCVCMDIGASTGGFTDCMLQNGAKRVYSIDVGYGQLAYKLRVDERVVCLERTNFRYVTNEQVPEMVDFVSVDVSFISLTKILNVAFELIKPEGEMVCLVKPQFEAGREKVGKKGVVRDPEVHKEVITKVWEFALETGFSVKGLSYSPIKGPEGNIEYLLYLKKGDTNFLKDGIIEETVNKAHESLD